MRYSLPLGALALAAIAQVAGAQTAQTWEIRPVAGVAIPLGSHRSAFNSAPIVGGELALRFTQTIDAVGLFSWQPSQSKYAVDTRRADVWVYNIGVERAFRGAQPTAGGVLVPFAGAGVGGRAYDFRSSALSSGACFAPYASGGAAYEHKRSTVRLEARDNVLCYKTPVAPYVQETHNEVSVLLLFGARF
jgi:hypothetical protein